MAWLTNAQKQIPQQMQKQFSKQPSDPQTLQDYSGAAQS